MDEFSGSHRMKAFKIPLLFLTIIGSNPMKIKKDAYTLFIIGFFAVVQFHNTVLLVMMICISLNDMDVLGEVMTCVAGMYQIIIKYIVTVNNQKSIYKHLLASLKYFPTTDKLEKQVTPVYLYMHKGLMVFAILFICCITLYVLKPLLYFEKLLPVIWYSKHCPLENNRCFAYHYTLQIFGASLMYFNIIGFDGFALALISVAYCELEKVKIGLTDLRKDDNKSDDENMRQISELVKKHCMVLDFIKMINTELSAIFMHQLAATLTGVCTGIYFLMLFQNDFSVVLRFVPYLLSIIAQMFLYSIAGEQIATQTQSIHFAAYDTNWYLKHQPKTTKALCMMMLRSKNPDEIIAGMWTWNMRIFLSLLQTGFSMFTFMKTVQSK